MDEIETNEEDEATIEQPEWLPEGWTLDADPVRDADGAWVFSVWSANTERMEFAVSIPDKDNPKDQTLAEIYDLDAQTPRDAVYEVMRNWPVEGQPEVPMTRDEYATKVRVLIVVEPQHVHLSDGALAGNTTFWVHTSGMVKHFDRSELELREVPAQFVNAAGNWLNDWAFYSIKKRIHAGESLADRDAIVHVNYVAEASPDPFWKGQQVPTEGPACLFFYPKRVAAPCAGAPVNGPHTDAT